MSAPAPPKTPFSKSAYVAAQAGTAHKAVHEYRDAPAHRTAGAQRLRIAAVEPESLAERIGLKPGDALLELDGKPLIDPVDFQFRSAETGKRMRLRTAERTLTFVRRDWEQVGLEFEPIEPLVCANQCVFCFVHQNPKNVRRSLHIKDEDYRLSFLFGNYLTLTNVDETELLRIIDQRLSPLYVSVHATEPELRAKLLGIAEYDGFMEKIARLADAGTVVHGQVVLCPGLNDGEHLERTVADLAAMHPGVASLAVVPVGLTRHRKNLPQLESFTPEIARSTIAHIGRLQKELQRRLGTPFVFIGDEIYIMAGAPIPPARHYRGFPQIENGVGMVRTFLGQFAAVAREWKRRPPKNPIRGTVFTGRVFHPFLKDCVDRLDCDLNVVAVESGFWGSGIGVAGLLTGSDFIAAMKKAGNAQDLGDFAVIPSECMIGDDRLFLDDLTLRDVEREAGIPVLPSGYNAREFARVLRDIVGR
jgi:putative radical SAM enzyme (TIGR03279 family)